MDSNLSSGLVAHGQSQIRAIQRSATVVTKQQKNRYSKWTVVTADENVFCPLLFRRADMMFNCLTLFFINLEGVQEAIIYIFIF